MYKFIGFPPPEESYIHQIYTHFVEKNESKLGKALKIWKSYEGKEIVVDPTLVKIIRKYGIAPSMRPKLWMILSRAKEKMKNNEGYYEKMQKVFMQNPPLDIIDEDVNVFPTHPYFSGKNPAVIDMMKRILIVYSCRSTSTCYNHSMAFILGVLLLHFSEQEAFWMFATLIEDILPPDFFGLKFKGILVDAAVIKLLIQQLLPRIHSHFEKLRFDITPFIVRWFKKLLVVTLPIETTLRVWDVMFCDGFEAVLRVLIALLKINESLILDKDHLGGMTVLLENITKCTFDYHNLIKQAYSYKQKDFSPERITKLRLSVTPEIDSLILRQSFLGHYYEGDKTSDISVREDAELIKMLQDGKREQFEKIAEEQFKGNLCIFIFNCLIRKQYNQAR